MPGSGYRVESSSAEGIVARVRRGDLSSRLLQSHRFGADYVDVVVSSGVPPSQMVGLRIDPVGSTPMWWARRVRARLAAEVCCLLRGNEIRFGDAGVTPSQRQRVR
jgi:hypothetical protein